MCVSGVFRETQQNLSWPPVWGGLSELRRSNPAPRTFVVPYLLTQVHGAQLGRLHFSIHHHVEHGADGLRHAEVDGPTAPLKLGLEGNPGPSEERDTAIRRTGGRLVAHVCVRQQWCYRFMQDSIMSLDISFSRVSRCFPNSSSGQWRSLMKVCRASSFQKRSSEVPEPLLRRGAEGRVRHRKWKGNDGGKLITGVGIQEQHEKGEGRVAG